MSNKQPTKRITALYTQQTFAAVNRRNPLGQKQRLELADIAQEDFVMLSEEISPASYDDLTAQLNRIRHPQDRRHYVFSTEALFTSVEANHGIAFIDGHNRLITSPYVRLIPVESSTKAPNFGAAWLRNTDKQAVYSFVSLLDS
jgi:DNA-binding transcriptional LysR family regulator